MLNAGGFAFTQVSLQQDIHGTKGNLNETNSNIIATKDQLSQLETGTSDSISKVNKDILFFTWLCIVCPLDWGTVSKFTTMKQKLPIEN